MTGAAVDPDQAGFDELVTPHRSALLAHCYRMTGSVHDAEDALQETLLRAWRSLDQFEGRSSLRTWLLTIATNCCRRLLEQRSRRVLPVAFGPPADPHGTLGGALEEAVWVTPFPGIETPMAPSALYEGKESVELAFIAALQSLPARQRAVLLMRDVLAFSAQETAEALGSSLPSVNSALQRARVTMAARLPSQTQQEALRLLGSPETERLVGRFVRAWEQHDVDALVDLLAEDIELAMPPAATWFRGREAVAVFLSRFPLGGPGQWVAHPVTANGQLAMAMYHDSGQGLLAENLSVLSLDGGLIASFVAFRSEAVFESFGLPLRLPSGGGSD